MDNRVRIANVVAGLATIGSAVIGIAGLVAALFPFFIGDFVAAALFLIAATLSFGFLALAVFR